MSCSRSCNWFLYDLSQPLIGTTKLVLPCACDDAWLLQEDKSSILSRFVWNFMQGKTTDNTTILQLREILVRTPGILPPSVGKPRSETIMEYVQEILTCKVRNSAWT